MTFCRKFEKCIIFVGSYTIGKERVFRAIAEALGAMVWVDKEKQKVNRNVVFEPANCNRFSKHSKIHYSTECLRASVRMLLFMLLAWDNSISRLFRWRSQLPQFWQKLQGVLNESWFKQNYKHILAIRPTGWTHQKKLPALTHIKPVKTAQITLYGMKCIFQLLHKF